MFPSLLLRSIAVLSVVTASCSLFAAPITITNPDFQPASGTSANFNQAGTAIPGWAGYYDYPSTGVYYNTTHNFYVAYVQNYGTVRVTQAPSVNTIAIQAGTYTIGFDTADDNSNASLGAGFLDTNGDTLPSGVVFSPYSAGLANLTTYSAVSTLVVPVGSPLIASGNNLGFYIENTQNTNYPSVANVTLNFVPDPAATPSVPEPASLSLLAAGSLLLLRKRRA